MSPPTLEQLQQLAEGLPLLQPRAPVAGQVCEDPIAQSYLEFYGIDFARRDYCEHHQMGVFQASGYRVAAHIWWPLTPKGTVFLLHGYTDSVGLMRHPIEFLLRQGWCVVALDLPGHGLSSGEAAAIDSFDVYVAALLGSLKLCKGHLPEPWMGAGQSTGCAVWLNYCASVGSDNTAVESLFLAAPLVRATNWQLIRWTKPLLGLFLDSIPRRFTANSHDDKFLEFVRSRDPLQPRRLPLSWIGAMQDWAGKFNQLPNCAVPVTVVQGDSDGTVDAGYNLKVIAEHCVQVELYWLEGARHQLFNESEIYRKRLFKHMSQWLEAAPAGISQATPPTL